MPNEDSHAVSTISLLKGQLLLTCRQRLIRIYRV